MALEKPEDLERCLDEARIMQAAEMLGLAQQAFEVTLDYLRNRKQFGVVIGSFQALQHRAAHLYGELEVLRSAVMSGLQALDQDSTEVALLASLAKAKACSVAIAVCNEAIQMHGGIGMTDEYFHLDRFAALRGY